MRKAKPETDFKVTVEGVGDFVYGRRTVGDSLKIRGRFLELAGDHSDDVEIASIASATAMHEVLCVSAPDGWSDILALDSADPENISRIFDLYMKVGETEDSFRDKTKVSSAQAGSGDGSDAGVLVQA